MKEAGWVDDTQLKAARKVLWAAGDTYAVALASSAVMLLRLIAMRGSKDDKAVCHPSEIISSLLSKFIIVPYSDF